MDDNVKAVKRAILTRGLDDWVHIAEVVLVARQGRGLPDAHVQTSATSDDNAGAAQGERLIQAERDALPLGIVAVKELLREGLIRGGEPMAGGFVAWRGTVEEIESRIDEVVGGAQYPLLPGHLFWVENTPSGDKVASRT